MKQPSLSAELAIDDAALAVAAGRGNQPAFRALYLRHHHRVLAFVTKFMGAGPDREDVVQDVFLQLYRALPKFRGDSSLSTFLRRITMHVAFDHMRRRSRHQRIDYDSDALDDAIGTGQDPEQHSSARQQLQSLFHHLDDIALDERRALLLVAIAGCSLNAAAAQMGANPYWVKQRLAGARRELRARTAQRHASRPPQRANAL